MTKTVTAYEARTNLGELLNEVYYKGDEIIIKKSGKPVARISRISESLPKKLKNKRDLLSLAGVWANEDGKSIRKYARMIRSNFKLLP